MGITRISVPGPTGWQNGCTMCGKPAREGLRSAFLLTGDSTRLSPMPSVGRLDLERNCSLGQRKFPSAKRQVSPAGRIHRVGKQRSDANQPPGVLSSGCVPLWESPEPHPCDRKAAPADEGCHPDLRAGRPDLRPFAGAGTTILAATESGYQAVGIEVTDAYYKLGSDRVRIALEAGAEAENKEPQ